MDGSTVEVRANLQCSPLDCPGSVSLCRFIVVGDEDAPFSTLMLTPENPYDAACVFRTSAIFVRTSGKEAEPSMEELEAKVEEL